MQHKCYTLQMSDSIVSLQYCNHSGPCTPEACLKVFSLYGLQCWILASTRCFRGLWRRCWNKNTAGQWKTVNNYSWNRQTGRNKNHPNLSWCWSDHSELTLWMQQCVCVRFYVCVSAWVPDGHSVLSRTHKDCGILIFSSYQKTAI